MGERGGKWDHEKSGVGKGVRTPLGGQKEKNVIRENGEGKGKEMWEGRKGKESARKREN